MILKKVFGEYLTHDYMNIVETLMKKLIYVDIYL